MEFSGIRAYIPCSVQYRNAVETFRNQEWHRLNAERGPANPLPTAELRRLLRRNWPSLTPAQQGQWVDLFAPSPSLASAYLLCILLTAIFEGTPDRATAQTRLQAWRAPFKALRVTGFDKLLNTLQSWQNEMLNYFEGRYNSGFVEGLNNKLKLLKRRCFGLDDPIKRFRRLWLDIEGARLWA